MSEDRLPEELTVLLRACERGDTRAPIQMLQCCITGMTLFKHSLPAAGRRALLDAMHELTLGVQFILAGDAEAEEEARVLKASVEQIQTEIEEMKRRRDDLGNALGLCRTERYSLQQELDWLTALREHADTLRSRELERALRQLARGEDPQAVLEAFSQGLANKLLHAPTRFLNEGEAEQQLEASRLVRRIFNLKPDGL